jgi:hypothetical protein
MTALLANDDKAFTLSDEAVESLAAFFLRARHSTNPEAAHYALEGLSFCATNPLSVPAVVTLLTEDISAAKALKVRVCDVLGGEIAGEASVVVKSDALIAKDLKLKAGPKGQETKFAAALPSDALKKVVPGARELVIQVTVDGKKSTTKQLVSVRTETSVTGLEITVGDGFQGKSRKGSSKGSSTPVTVKVAYAESMKAEFGKLDSFKKLTFALDSSGVLEQAFLRLTNTVNSAESSYYVFGADGSLELDLGKAGIIAGLFGPGSYEVSVLFGGANSRASSEWAVGVIEVDVEGTRTVDDAFAARPEIHHKFQPEHVQPMSIASPVIVGVLVLAFVRLLQFTVLGGKIELDIQSGALYSLIFQGAIGATLGMFVFYWLWLNIFDAMSLMLVLGPLLLFSGNRALRAHYRQEHAKK